jgi:hypothetical protein
VKRIMGWTLCILFGLTMLGSADAARALAPSQADRSGSVDAREAASRAAPFAQAGSVAMARLATAGDCDARGWADHSLAARTGKIPGLLALPPLDLSVAGGSIATGVDLPEPVLTVRLQPLAASMQVVRVAIAPARAWASLESRPPLRPPRA